MCYSKLQIILGIKLFSFPSNRENEREIVLRSNNNQIQN